MTEDEFRALCLSFPDAVEGINMGSTYFKANGKDWRARMAKALDAAKP